MLVIYSHIPKYALDASSSLHCLNVYHKEGFLLTPLKTKSFFRN